MAKGQGAQRFALAPLNLANLAPIARVVMTTQVLSIGSVGKIFDRQVRSPPSIRSLAWWPNKLEMGLLSTVQPDCVYFELPLWSSLSTLVSQFRRADPVGLPELVVEEASSQGLRLH